AALDRDRGLVQVTFHFRDPFEPEDFWCQAAPGKWQATLVKRSPTVRKAGAGVWFSSSVEGGYPSEADELSIWARRKKRTAVCDKTRKWLLIRDEVLVAIGNQWKLHAVIIAALPHKSLPPAELSGAADAGVLVITAEDLAFLSDQSPDVGSFAEALRRDPNHF